MGKEMSFLNVWLKSLFLIQFVNPVLFFLVINGIFKDFNIPLYIYEFIDVVLNYVLSDF